MMFLATMTAKENVGVVVLIVFICLPMLWLLYPHWYHWLFPKHPERIVNVGKAVVRVSFAGKVDDITREFVGSASYSAAFGLMLHSARGKAEEFIDGTNPIELEDGSFVPRNRVVLYTVDVTDHNAPAKSVR